MDIKEANHLKSKVSGYSHVRSIRRWPRLNTIRARLLIAFVLAVLLSGIAISTVTFVLGTRDGRQREVDQLESVVTLKQAEIKSWVNSLSINLDLVTSDYGELSDLTTLVNVPEGTDNYLTAYNSLLSRFQWASVSMGLFNELFFMDTQGNVILSTKSAHENEKHSIYDYFTEGVKGLYIQQPSYSLSQGEMTVVASAPVKSGGRLLGVIAGRASLQSLNTIMKERAGLGETGETYLVGSNHRLLTELRDESFSIPVTYIRTLGADSALIDHNSGSATYTNYSGKTVIGVYRWLPDIQVGLLAEQEQGEALHGTTMVMLIIAVVALAVISLALLAALALTRGIVRPLAELATTATQIAEGDLDRIASVRRDDEVGILAMAFNTMTSRLRNLVRSLEKRTDQLRAINETGRHISSILEVDELMEYVAGSLQKTFKYHNVGIVLVDVKNGALALKSSVGAYEGGADTAKGDFKASGIVSSVARTGDSIVVNDVRNDPRYSGSEGSGHTRAELAVPIKVSDRIVGVLDIEEDSVNAFDDLDLFTAQTLADQLAIAIENARLYKQAQELATMEERQRLARDLHDAVSQTLFSASLISEVLPRLWERNQDEGRRRLEEVRQLTRGALAEMRTLLLELRPATLVDADPAELIRQLAESITGRARIPVQVSVSGYCPLSPEIKVALYRISQEALNNVAKHSGATQAAVSLHCEQNKIELIIRDDGRGFDMKTRSPNSLGLGIMQERAKSIGAIVNIESILGSGTTVTVDLESKPGRNNNDDVRTN